MDSVRLYGYRAYEVVNEVANVFRRTHTAMTVRARVEFDSICEDVWVFTYVIANKAKTYLAYESLTGVGITNGPMMLDLAGELKYMYSKDSLLPVGILKRMCSFIQMNYKDLKLEEHVVECSRFLLKALTEGHTEINYPLDHFKCAMLEHVFSEISNVENHSRIDLIDEYLKICGKND